MADKKISELARAGALGAGVLLAAAQGGANYSVPAPQVMPSRPFVQLWTDGDSKAAEPAQGAIWALARDPREVWLTRNFGVGGSQSGTGSSPLGLTNATRMATIAAAMASETASSIVDVVLTIGTNDISASVTPETVIANVRKYHNAIRANGARFLIIMAVDPRASLSAAFARSQIALNRAYADYCEAVTDAIFCDPSPWWMDPASSAFAPIGGATGAAFSMGADGLHANAYGCYFKQFALAGIFQQLYRPRALEVLSAADVYNTADSIRGNILGAGGRFMAMGGTNSITNSGSGSVSGTPPANFTASGTLDGTVSIAFTAENSAHLASKFGGTWPCVRASLSGAFATTRNVQLAGRFASYAQSNTLPMIGRALFACNAVTGLAGIYLQTQNVSPTNTAYLGASGTPVAADQLPQLDGLFSLDMFVAPTTNLNSGLNLIIRGIAGVALGGSIDLIGIDWRRWDPMPAAAP